MMNRWKKQLTTILVICLMCVCAAPVSVQAASINVTLGTTDNARTGDTVTARIILSNNPGLSTFAMKLAYDSNYLTYRQAKWSDTLASNNNNVQLVSEVTENGGPVLNISSIMNANYSNNETIVTIEFTVKQNYTTMPVTLTNREITDTSYAPVTANPVVDASAGQTNNTQNTQNSQTSQGQIPGNSQNNSQNNNNNNNDDDDDDREDDEPDDNRDDADDSDKDDTSDNKSDNKSEDKSDDKKLDETPKTGALDLRFVLGGVIVVFLAIAGICIKVLGKKRIS